MNAKSRRKGNQRNKTERKFLDYGTPKAPDRLHKLTYMQVVVVLFLTGLLLFLVAFIRSVSTRGNAGLEVSFLMLASIVFGLAGIILSLYGHRYIRVSGGMPYQAGVVGCGVLVAINLAILVAGLIP